MREIEERSRDSGREMEERQSSKNSVEAEAEAVTRIGVGKRAGPGL